MNEQPQRDGKEPAAKTANAHTDGGAEHYSGRSLWREAGSRLWARRSARWSLIAILLYTLVAFTAEFMHQWYRSRDITPPYKRPNLEARYLPPSVVRGDWSHLGRHPLGTDNLGRDVALRLAQGARVAFHVGIITSLVALPIGLFLGCLAGYFGGWPDRLIVWLYSTVAAFPTLLLILAITIAVGKGLTGIYLGIGLTTWVSVCRLIRGEVMRQKSLAYVKAARTLGYSHARILFLHILPNVTHIAVIVFSLRFPAAVSTEVFISFLGLGVQDEPSWGVMIDNARARLWHGVWWEMTFVTIAIFLLVLSFNILGDALRDALDPRLRVRAARD